MVIFTSKELIVQRKNVDACQWLEYTAMLVQQYCKETADRRKRLYDLRGVEICNMAGDLKDFVKGYWNVDTKKAVYANNISSSMIIAIHDALKLFGEVYDSGSSKSCAQKLESLFPAMFKYKKVVDVLLSKLKEQKFCVCRSDSASTSSVYLNIDYNSLSKIRISDHYVPFEGLQLLLSEEKPKEAGTKGVFHIKPDYEDAMISRVEDFIVSRLVSERSSLLESKYKEMLNSIKSDYKDQNPNYQEVSV